jgi:hypothetical protein
VGGEAPVTPVSSPDSSSLDLSYKPCDNRYHFYFWNRIASTRYQLVPRGDTNEAAQDLCVMVRMGDRDIHMIDGVIAHMMMEGTMIELSHYIS